MAYIDDLTFVNALGMTDNDILYVGKPGDIDPDRRTSVAELAERVRMGITASGTFNATLTASTTAPTVTYSSRLGRWVRVGNVVTFNLSLITASRSGGSGEIRITGLPHNPVDATVVVTGRVANIAFTGVPYFWIATDGSIRIGRQASNAGVAQLAIGDWGAAGSVHVAGSYIAS